MSQGYPPPGYPSPGYPPGGQTDPPQMYRTAAASPPSRTPLVLGILGGVVAVGALFCCGGALLVVNFGMSIVSAEVQDQLASRPEIQENIGPIESFKVNYARTGTHDDDDTFVYDIEGPNGRGYVTVKQYTDENDAEVIESAVLTMNDGRKIPIEF